MSTSAGPAACAGDVDGDGCDAVEGGGAGGDGTPDAAGTGVEVPEAGGASGAAAGWVWAGLSVDGDGACWAAASPCNQIKATDVVPNRTERATQTRIPNPQRRARKRVSKSTNM